MKGVLRWYGGSRQQLRVEIRGVSRAEQDVTNRNGLNVQLQLRESGERN